MRRPLFVCSFCLVLLMAVRYACLPASTGSRPPDGTDIILTGQVCRKDEISFVIKVRESIIQESIIQEKIIPNSTIQKSAIQNDAAVLRQDNPSEDSLENLTEDLTENLAQSLAGSRLLCEYEASEELMLDASVALQGKFYAFSPATNPGEFDYARYYHSMGYEGRLKQVKLIGTAAQEPGIREGLYRLRRFWEERLYRIFPEKEASVMAAVLLGDKAGVDADLKALYQKNGIIHILSISGLHITLIGMGLYKILRRAGMPVWCAAAGGAVFLILYGVMTGLGVSACRAIAMYLLRMLAQLLGRTYDMLTAVGVTAVCMVCLHPAWLEHMGFLLSYGSVLGVGILLPALAESGEEAPRVKRYIQEKWKRRLASLCGGLWRGLRQSLLAGISITFTTLPIQLWFAYEIPVYSILLNVLVLPFMSVVMAAGLFAMLIPGMGVVGTVDVLILAGYEKLCAWFGRLPHTMWNPGRPEVWQIAVYYLLWAGAVGCAGLYGHSGCRGRRGRGGTDESGRTGWPGVFAGIKCVQALLLAAAVWTMGLSGRNGDSVTFLDVGQGDCICVRLSSGEVYLFDCGSSSRSRVGERVLIPFLKYSGIGKIDAVFVSHGDQDHMNGIVELLNLSEQEHIEVGGLVLPGIDRSLWNKEFGELLEAAEGTVGQREIPVSVIRAGESWAGGRQGEDRFLCLHPSAEGNGAGGNEGSACYYIELQEGERRISLMLTGDVEGVGEQELLRELQNQGIRDITLLKAAHHGSRNSTKEELLEQISPAFAIISCGRSNRYGHPHPELLQRLAECDTQILQTPQSGAVTLILQPDAVTLRMQFGSPGTP